MSMSASRPSRGWLWVLLLLAACLVAGVRSRPPTAGGLTPPGELVATVTQPAQAGLTRLGRGIGGAFGSFTHWLSLDRQNDLLRRQVERAAGQAAQLAEWREEVTRLQALVGLKDQLEGPTVAARTVARGPSPWFQTLTIDAGRREGVHPGCAVLGPGGLVGQVTWAGPRGAEVLCLTDRRGRVGARVVPDRARQVVGVLAGDGGETCRLVSDAADADVRPGDPVVTSGQEQGSLFPAGLPVGWVLAVERRPDEATLLLTVRPAALPDRVEEVLVLLGTAAEEPAG